MVRADATLEQRNFIAITQMRLWVGAHSISLLSGSIGAQKRIKL